MKIKKTILLIILLTIISLSTSMLYREREFCTTICYGFPFPVYCDYCLCAKDQNPFDIKYLLYNLLIYFTFWVILIILFNFIMKIKRLKKNRFYFSHIPPFDLTKRRAHD